MQLILIITPGIEIVGAIKIAMPCKRIADIPTGLNVNLVAGVKLEDGLYRGLMRRGAGDELAAGCAKSQMFHDAAQATM